MLFVTVEGRRQRGRQRLRIVAYDVKLFERGAKGMLQEKGHLTEFSEVGYGSKRAVVPHVDYHVLVMVIPI